jgi:hypothetical protein
MNLPPLPPRSGKVEFTYLLNGVPTEGEITFHTEEDFIAYGRQCVEAAADECDKYMLAICGATYGESKAIRNMLKGEA